MGIAERKEREKEQRRNEIIEAAEKIFFEKGINNATMDDVANHAELSKGTLYLYFKNKEDLYYAICTKGLSVLNNILKEKISEHKSPIENLAEIGRAYIKFAREYNDHFVVMTHFDAFAYSFMNNESDNPHVEDIMNTFVQIIERGQKEGVIRNHISPELMAHLLWTQTTGVLKMMSAIEIHHGSLNISEDEILQGHFSIMADGINNTSELLTNRLTL